MRLRQFYICGVIFSLVCCSNRLEADDRISKEKQELCGIVNSRLEEDWQAALQIWNFAEPGYQETKSSALLSSMLERAGFKITKPVAGIPTAFTAEFSVGENSPVIGILGEFDALPGLSQEAVPYRKVSEGKSYGHACGHHLFGV
ncbi:MAG TPA: hypothetical protein VLA12_16425, partial [Planctomycetaceae bacterium]|nr:hypothetical protein [Planctomycetaceae bacterium]